MLAFSLLSFLYLAMNPSRDLATWGVSGTVSWESLYFPVIDHTGCTIIWRGQEAEHGHGHAAALGWTQDCRMERYPLLLYRLYNSQREGRQFDLRLSNEWKYGLPPIKTLLVGFVSDDGSIMDAPATS